jgi:hypothetical protein
MVAQAQPALAGNGTGHWWPSRYGPDDQAGALNEITPRKVLEAVLPHRLGIVVGTDDQRYAAGEPSPGRAPNHGRISRRELS